MPVGDLARLPARFHDVDRLLRPRGVGARIRIGPPEKLQIAAAHKHDAAPVRRPVQLPDIDPIVRRVISHARAFEIGRRRHPDIASPAFVE